MEAKGRQGCSGALKKAGVAAVVLCLLALVAPSSGIRCYQCGQYTDGVGSITPCVNYTEALHLKECPKNKNHCVKYVSEGSTVRECEASCTEKDTWGTKVFCCNEDGCNSTNQQRPSWLLMSLVSSLAAVGAVVRRTIDF